MGVSFSFVIYSLHLRTFWIYSLHRRSLSANVPSSNRSYSSSFSVRQRWIISDDDVVRSLWDTILVAHHSLADSVNVYIQGKEWSCSGWTRDFQDFGDAPQSSFSLDSYHRTCGTEPSGYLALVRVLCGEFIPALPRFSCKKETFRDMMVYCFTRSFFPVPNVSRSSFLRVSISDWSLMFLTISLLPSSLLLNNLGAPFILTKTPVTLPPNPPTPPARPPPPHPPFEMLMRV